MSLTDPSLTAGNHCLPHDSLSRLPSPILLFFSVQTSVAAKQPPIWLPSRIQTSCSCPVRGKTVSPCRPLPSPSSRLRSRAIAGARTAPGLPSSHWEFRPLLRVVLLPAMAFLLCRMHPSLNGPPAVLLLPSYASQLRWAALKMFHLREMFGRCHRH